MPTPCLCIRFFFDFCVSIPKKTGVPEQVNAVMAAMSRSVTQPLNEKESVVQVTDLDGDN